jgi:hypothetical protein
MIVADQRRVKSSSASHSATGLQPVIPRLQTAKRIAVRESDVRGKIYFELAGEASFLYLKMSIATLPLLDFALWRLRPEV